MSRLKSWWPILLLLLVGTGIFVWKCRIVAPIEWVGHAEEADYPEIAESILQGKGISVEFIGYSYWYSPLRYPEITHPDAHYPPLYSFLIVPFFLLMGKSAFAAKLPALLIGSVLLPLVMYGLVRRLTGNRVVGVAAGIASLLYPAIFSHSLRPDDDVLFPVILLASMLFFLKSEDSPRLTYVAGIVMGLAYYSKGTAILLLPAFGLYLLLSRGWRLWRDRQVIRFYAAALLVMLPWFVRTALHFGNPLFSSEQYAAGYIGYESWEIGTYSLRWDEERPTLLDKFRHAGYQKVRQKSVEFLKQYAWWEFMDIHEKWGKFSKRAYLTAFTGLAALLGWVLALIGGVLQGVRRWWRYRHPFFRFLASWYHPDLLLLWLVGMTLTLFQAICWEPIPRLAFTEVLINMAVGWATYYRLGRWSFSWTESSTILATCLILLVWVPMVSASGNALLADRAKAGWPYRDTNQHWVRAGKWLKQNAPGSVTMTRNPWELHFYSGGKAVQIPLTDLDRTLQIMRFYGVTHLIPQLDIRPALKPILDGKVPGFELVYNDKLRIYAVNLDALPEVP